MIPPELNSKLNQLFCKNYSLIIFFIILGMLFLATVIYTYPQSDPQKKAVIEKIEGVF